MFPCDFVVKKKKGRIVKREEGIKKKNGTEFRKNGSCEDINRKGQSGAVKKEQMSSSYNE